MLCVDMRGITMSLMNRSYSELIRIPTFEERFKYLQLSGSVGDFTFGSKRHINQVLYKTPEWLSVRDKVIIRDNGCDLGIPDRLIGGRVLVHHMNPITIDDILNRNPKVFDMDNLISVSHITHEAIHYGNEDLLMKDPIERCKNDTCPWRH